MGEIRLNKIIRKYNIGIQNLIEFLKTKGVEVEENPNAKISDEYLPDIEKQFGKDLADKEASEKVDIKLTEIIEKSRRKQEEAQEEEEEPVQETVIKSNVFSSIPIKEEPEIEKKPEPEPEPVPEPEPEPEPEHLFLCRSLHLFLSRSQKLFQNP